MNRAALAFVVSLALSACSIQQMAINSVGEMLASSGTSVFLTDDDPALIGEALPFSLKLIESLLTEQPDNVGLLLAAARGYLLYTYAFVNVPAEEARLVDIDRTRLLRERARKLYLRAHGYARRALALDHPALAAGLVSDPAAAVGATVLADRDVPELYYTAASLGLAISVSRNEPALLARLPEVEALLERALAIDEAWERGALHEFAISLAGAGTAPIDASDVERHYRRALDLSGGNSASLHVTYAEVVAVPRQDREQFTALLLRALMVDLDSAPDQRLLNVIAQQRAEWLLENVDEFIL